MRALIRIFASLIFAAALPATAGTPQTIIVVTPFTNSSISGVFYPDIQIDLSTRLSATPSGLPLTFTSLTPATCTVSGTMLTLTQTSGPHICMFTADQGGDGTYDPAPQATVSFDYIKPGALQDLYWSPIPPGQLNAPLSVNAITNTGLPVSYATTTPAICSVSGNVVSPLSPGTCWITASHPAGNGWIGNTIARNLTVRAAQTISFPAQPDRQVGDSYVASATASSGLPVTLASSTPAVCAVSGATIFLNAAGTCAITASQAGDATYAPAPDVTRSFQVRATQVINFPPFTAPLLPSGAAVLSATASSGLPVSYASQTPAVCTVTGSAVTAVAAGTCTIAADQPGDATYLPAAQVTRSAAIALLAQTISFSSLPSSRPGDAPIPLLATASSGLPITFASLTPAICTVSGASVSPVAVGSCQVTANQSGNAIYSAAPQYTQFMTVLPLASAQSINYPAPGDQPLDSTQFIVATATSGLPVTFTSLTPLVCTVTGTGVDALALGMCTVAADQAGDASWLAAPQVSRSWMITKKSQTIDTFIPTPFSSIQAGGTTNILAHATSNLPVAATSLTPGVCTVTGYTITGITAGTCTIAGDQAGDAEWLAAPQVTLDVTITPAAALAQTISFGPLANKIFGDAPFTVSATASSGLPVSFSSLTTARCTVSGNTVTIVAAGSCTIAADQAGDATYGPAPQVTQSFFVQKSDQTITFGALPDRTLGDAPFAVSATASSGLPVSFSSTTPARCTVAGSTVTIVATGGCTIAASQAGDADWNGALTVFQAFTISPPAALPQSINFPSLADTALGSPAPALAATASSGLPVSYTTLTPPVCFVGPGPAIMMLSTGTCTIAANQAGNGTYSAAPQVTQSFQVTSAALLAQTITFPPLANSTLGGASPTLAATASSGLPVSYTTLTPGQCVVAGPSIMMMSAGLCTIAANQAGNATYSAAPQVTQSFTISAAAASPQTISFGPLPGRTLGTAPFAVSATASSGLPVSFSSLTPGQCTVSGSTVTLVAVGPCTIAANQAGNASWLAAPQVTQTFFIAPPALLPQTISFSALPGRTLGDAPFTVSATASSGLPVSFTTQTPARCAITGNLVTLVSVGPCTIAANQAGNGTYSAAPQVAQTFFIAPAPLLPQSITFPAIADRQLSAAPFTVTATASSGLAVNYSSLTPSVCAAFGPGNIFMTTVGTCTIAANQPGNATYSAAPQVTRSFQITSPPPAKSDQTITFNALADKAFGSAPFAITATATSGLPVSFAGSTPAVCTLAGNTVTVLAVGTCTIAADQAGDASWNPAPTVTRSFNVTAAAATVALGGLSHTYDGTQKAATCTTTPAGLTTSITYNDAGSGTGRINAGSYGVSCNITQAGYSGSATGTLTITKAPQTITFTQPTAPAFSVGATFALTATASSGLPVAFSSTTTAVCTVAGATATLVAPGTCTIAADQAGDSNWLLAPQVTRSVALAKLAQTITFTPFTPDQITLGKAQAMTANATASSGLPVTLTSADSAICEVSGNVVTEKSAGTCAITATQGGDAVYDPAAPVTRTFTIVAAPSAEARIWIYSSPSPSRYRAPVTVKVGVAGSQPAKGTVTVTYAGRLLEGCENLALDVDGNAECSSRALIPGAHDLEVSYSGDAFYLPTKAKQPHYVKSDLREQFRDANATGKAALHLETEHGGLGVQLVDEVQLGEGDVLIDERQGWAVERFLDANKDAKADVLLRHTDGRLDIAIMDGLRIRERAPLFKAEDKVETLAIGDFDGSGMDGVLIARPWENGMKVLEVVRLEGAFIVERIAFGIIANEKIYANTYGLVSGDWDLRLKAGESPKIVIADFDGDGQDDVAFIRDDNKIRIVLMQRGSRGPSIDYEVPHGFKFDRALDQDGDYRADLLFRGPNGELSVWIMNGLERRAVSQLDVAKNWIVTDAADFDVDGRDDLVLQHDATGAIRIRLHDGRFIEVRGALPADMQPEAIERLWAVKDYANKASADFLFYREVDGQMKLERRRGGELERTEFLIRGDESKRPKWIPIP
jgi:hypothetical protein